MLDNPLHDLKILPNVRSKPPLSQAKTMKQSHAFLRSRSSLRSKITLERKKQVGNVHSRHVSCLSPSVNAPVASTSLGNFLPAIKACSAGYWDQRECFGFVVHLCVFVFVFFSPNPTICTGTEFMAICFLALNGHVTTQLHLYTLKAHLSEASGPWNARERGCRTNNKVGLISSHNITAMLVLSCAEFVL